MTRRIPLSRIGSAAKVFGRAVTAAGWVLLSSAAGAQTTAGAVIENTATVAFSLAAEPAVGRSNADRLIVAERLDVTLAPAAAARGVILANPGNGTEAFDVSASATDAVVRRIVIDRDGDGRVGDGESALDARTPALPPGGALALLVEVDAAGPAPAITITAQAATGSGPPGTIVERGGDGGGDAVTGLSGADATLTITPATASTPTLAKRQHVRAPDGSARAVAGAVVTYTLEAAFPAAVSLARIDDDIPAGTRLAPGSVTLDGVALTDTADADPGAASAAGISVTLASPAAGARHIVQFQTVIQ